LLRSRDLTWDGCLNVRDLGGHPVEGGGETQFGRIVRADKVGRLSKEGWQALVDYGIRTIIDLRTDEERAADPPADVPLEALHVKFMDDTPDVFAAADKASLAAPDLVAATRDVYLIFLEAFRSNVAAVIEAVADAPDGGVVVHCAGGKDRTGLTVAFLLRLAGVGLEEIAADYALSEERLRPRHEQWLADAADDEERERLRRLTVTPAAAMVGVLEELERRYGSVEEFLVAGGAREGIGERIRKRLAEASL
jgi:protein tyrosine/serine phosphatase